MSNCNTSCRGFIFWYAAPIAGIQIVRKTKKKDKKKKKKNRSGELDPENNPAKAVDVKKIIQDKWSPITVPPIIFILVRPVRATKLNRQSSLDRGSGRL